MHSLKVDGKRIYGLNKRPYPEGCEMCNRGGLFLSYHHWEDHNPNMGLWLCNPCHFMAEAVDKGYHNIYLRLKGEIVDGRLL